MNKIHTKYKNMKIDYYKELEKEDKKQVYSVTKFFEAQDDAFRKKKFARQFIVMQFFNKIKNVQELISYIKLEHIKTK